MCKHHAAATARCNVTSALRSWNATDLQGMFDKKRCLYDTLYSGISENKQRDVEPMSSATKDVRADEMQQAEGAAEPSAKQLEIDSLLKRADDARDDKLWTIAAEAYAAVPSRSRPATAEPIACWLGRYYAVRCGRATCEL